MKTQSNEPTISNITKSFHQPENQSKKYDILFANIDEGRIKLPRFQRDFVWKKDQAANLIDSIVKGFPIGTFIFWRTKENLSSVKNIGNAPIPETPNGDYANYILDGQQRITTLYAVRKGIIIGKVDYKNVFINLEIEPNNLDEKICVEKKEDGKRYISVYHLLNSKTTEIYKEFVDDEIREKIEHYKNKIITYDFSTILIDDYPIEVACEIFSRINTGGKILTIFEIMVAKTYEDETFDLLKKYEQLLKSLEKQNFDTIPKEVILKCVSAILTDGVKGKDILNIEREEFINTWQPMTKALYSAVEFVRDNLKIKVSKLLPYPAILVALTYFFHENNKSTPEQHKKLEQFFYWVGLTKRYQSSSDTKIIEDIKKMNKIIANEKMDYIASDLQVNIELIKNKFSPGNADCKAILCLLYSLNPKSFCGDKDVNLDNSNLKNSSSKNYHHFFPIDYIKKAHKELNPNVIANITILDAECNQKIGRKPPSKYLEIPNFNKNALKTHLIKDTLEYGLSGTDDYEKFIAKRAERIALELDKKLNPVMQ